MIDLSAARSGAEALQIALAEGRAALAGEDPGRDARVLLALAADVPVAGLARLDLSDFSGTVLSRYMALLDRRKAGEPVSHLRGTRAFWKHEFVVTADVLDPRPETETLIEAALQQPFSKVLDLGTGSGCILLSLLSERPEATGLGVDVSEAALEIAARNRARLGLETRADLLHSDWFGAVEGRFDLIVANPPYIDAKVYETLAPEVRLFEPQLALSPGKDGTAPYRVIAAGVCDHLSNGGRLIVEVGFDQGPAVSDIFRQAGLENVHVLSDLDGRARAVTAHPAR